MTNKLLLSLSDLARYLGVTRPTAYKFVKATGFPKPVPFGLDERGQPLPPKWDKDTIDAWRSQSSVDA